MSVEASERSPSRVRVNGVEIAYDEFGESGGGDAASGAERPLVLIHGLTGHRGDWDGRRSQLASLGRNLAPDLRGHGDSSNGGTPAEYDFETLVADLRGFLDALAVDRCDLLGHSFGGMIALRFTLESPERVASLVAMDTAPAAPTGYARAIFERGGEFARAEGMDAFQGRIEEAARSGKRPPSPSDRHLERWADRYWPHHRRRYRALDPWAYQELGLAMVEQAGVVDRLGEIACPTLVLVGEDDDGFLEGADLLGSGIPGATRVTIPNAGHHPHEENPEAWWAALRAHLEGVRGRAVG